MLNDAWLLGFGAIVAVLGLLFSLLALVMVGSFAATPQYGHDRAVYNVATWGVAALTFGFLALGLIVLTIRAATRRE
jgi:hypothetical protein